MCAVRAAFRGVPRVHVRALIQPVFSRAGELRQRLREPAADGHQLRALSTRAHTCSRSQTSAQHAVASQFASCLPKCVENALSSDHCHCYRANGCAGGCAILAKPVPIDPPARRRRCIRWSRTPAAASETAPTPPHVSARNPESPKPRPNLHVESIASGHGFLLRAWHNLRAEGIASCANHRLGGFRLQEGSRTGRT